MEPFLKTVSLLRERIEDPQAFPFALPAFRNLEQLEFHPGVTFFVGENGTGKSTLLEAIAAVEGLNLEGGSRNHNFANIQDEAPLSQALRLGRGCRRLNKSEAFFIRGESFFNLVTATENLGYHYAERSLHRLSHGEAFLALLENRIHGNSLCLFDEPESALSPLRQLAFLKRVHDMVQDHCQFVIVTHSPILMGYPDARLFHFSETGIREIAFEQTEHYRITKTFLANPSGVLNELLR